MQRQYEAPEAEILILSVLDVITLSSGLSLGNTDGTSGGSISFNEWLDKVGDYGDGSEDDDGGIDIGGLFG